MSGYSDTDIAAIGRLVDEFGPAYNAFGPGLDDETVPKIGPRYEYFADLFARLEIETNDDTIEHARRLWLNAQSLALEDTERRYGQSRPDFEEVYRQVVEAQQNAHVIVSPVAVVANPPVAEISSPVPQTESVKSAEPDTPPPSLLGLIEKLAKSKRQSGEWEVKTSTQHMRLGELFVKFVGSDDPRQITQAHLGVDFREELTHAFHRKMTQAIDALSLFEWPKSLSRWVKSKWKLMAIPGHSLMKINTQMSGPLIQAVQNAATGGNIYQYSNGVLRTFNFATKTWN